MCRLVPGTGLGFGGSSGSEPGSRVSFPKYPGLLELLSRLLTPTEDNASAVGGSTDIVTERVFPALELVGEKIPTFSDNHDTMLRALVLEHMKSPVWGVREHAARVYASLLTRNNILQDVSNLVDISPSAATDNFLHGIALCVRYSLRRFSSVTDLYWMTHIQGFLETIRRVLASILPLARSPAVAATLIEILNDAVERAIKAEIESKTASFLDEVSREFDLHGILTHVFDTSHAGWNISSLTRASSLLRRALAWCMTLRMLVSGKWGELTQFYLEVVTFDVDAARWILEELVERIGEKKRYRKPLADLYASAILADSPANIKTAAASNLASILEGLLLSELETVKGMGLPWEKIGGSFRPESNIQLWNRDATDAELRLCGCLLTIRIASGEWQSPSSFDGELRGWAVKLRSALSEETEFTSRYAAVASLGSFSKILRVPNCPPRIDPILLDIYLALYDMLNDDDEELRDMAAATASWALSYSSVSPNAAVTLGPLNASALLAAFIADNFAESPTLTENVVRYITGQQPRISGSDSRSRLLPVSDIVAEHRKESTVLFMEEKQNLFIDGVREVDVWAPALLRLKESAYKESVVRDLSCWASQGLVYLTELANESAGQDGLLGWISKPETFTVGVRLIGIASVLVAEKFPLPNYMSVGQDELHRQMQTLWVIGVKASFHDEWLSRIQQGLGTGVKYV
ncbi:hypothetical protein N7510_006527 [Penicillium lagena]|uniref:uncharacterized protein n=1 Tax=Penicillium lagena TaxID=94218 RepID=UPI002541CF47|nr:uncharacterized protein N7510_006527 [Penicillium lagena]KAJ5613333.1 hypothetical protein N7510_006527 [Penicillium lagena]